MVMYVFGVLRLHFLESCRRVTVILLRTMRITTLPTTTRSTTNSQTVGCSERSCGAIRRYIGDYGGGYGEMSPMSGDGDLDSTLSRRAYLMAHGEHATAVIA